MNPNCISKVAAAAGRALTDAEIKKIEDRISGTMKSLSKSDPDWQSYPPDARVQIAAQQAMADIKAEAVRKVENAQRQVLATLENSKRIAELKTNMKVGQSRALVEHLNNIHLQIQGIGKQYFSGLTDLIEASASTEGSTAGRKVLQFLFDADNPQMTKDLVAEIFANGKGGTGNKVAQAGAKAWLQTIESMRVRFNAAGGDVGKLIYGYLPQPHDSARIREAGRKLTGSIPTPDEAKTQWANDTFPLLDRKQYVNVDGSRMGDADVMDMLRGAWETLASNGLNKTEPGQFRGAGAKANRGSDSRVLHFKDGEAYMQYNATYGMGSMYDAMIGHVGGMARNIGLVENMGPNPNQQFRLQLDLAERADGTIERSFTNKPQAYWDIISGNSGTPDSARMAQIGQHMRNVQTFGKLAGAVISSITDLSTMMVTTGYNKLSYWELLQNTMTAGGKDAKEFANMHGMIAESMINDLNRFQGESIANNWSGRLANSTMKLSLMNAWTDTMRRGFSLTMMSGLGKLSKTEWSKLTEWDRSHLGRKGITEADWQVVNAAQLSDYRGQAMLTPEAIAASGHPEAAQITSKILGFITDESEYAVMNPDLATRAIQTWGGTQAGTINGEFARSLMQFKSFPIAMISRHWRRMLEGGASMDGAPVLANKAAYTAAMLITTTALGAVAFQTKQVIQGKDPVDMSNPKFWTRAVAQGGGAGFLGDVVLTDHDEGYGDPVANWFKVVAGPSIGAAGELLIKLGLENASEVAKDKTTRFGEESFRFIRSHTPYVNMWYGKAALDHMLLHGLQENLSPGYLERQKARAQQDWQQDWWWEPGEAAPDRAPDLSAIGGN
jgi:hypothetical protein